MNLKEIKILLKAIEDKKEGFLLGYHIIKQMERMWGTEIGQQYGAIELLKLLEMCEKAEPIQLEGGE